MNKCGIKQYIFNSFHKISVTLGEGGHGGGDEVSIVA